MWVYVFNNNNIILTLDYEKFERKSNSSVYFEYTVNDEENVDDFAFFSNVEHKIMVPVLVSLFKLCSPNRINLAVCQIEGQTIPEDLLEYCGGK